MLHEHVLRGTRAPGGGRAPPAPLLFLDSGRALQPRRLLSSLTQKCFVSLPDPHGEGQSVQLRFFAVVWVGWGGRVRTVRAQSLRHRPQVPVLGSSQGQTEDPTQLL